jgi:3-hydroxyacyl-[acyl-carrier-protein] dehydratase
LPITVRSVLSEAGSSSSKLRQLLRGFPESTVLACEKYEATADPEVLETAVCGVIQHYLEKPPAVDVVHMPGTTRLVADLGLDSLTMIEMIFLIEDLFGAKVPHEELIKITTLDELRALLRARLSARVPGGA